MGDWNGVDNSLLTRLERLRLQPKKSYAGRIRGERLSPKKGISIEFADYRHYAPGDDLRHLDWNILARLDRASIRTYRDEEELPVYLLLDASASMEFGEPPKYETARTLAACIGYIALCGADALYPVALTGRARETRALRGRSAYRRLSEWLSAVEPSGIGLPESVRRFVHASSRSGMAFLISDGLDPQFPESLRALAGRGHEVVFLHTLSDVELDPDLEGDLRLLDAENGQTIEITATGGVIQEYRRRLKAFCDELEAMCKRLGAQYLLVQSNEPVEEVIFKHLRRTGVIA